MLGNWASTIVGIVRRLPDLLTWNLLTATAPSDRDLTASGVTFRAKVMELKTATTVKAWVCTNGENGQYQCELWTTLSGLSHIKERSLQLPEMHKPLIMSWNDQFLPEIQYLSSREVVAQGHVQGERAHTSHHHNDGRHAHCEALDDPGFLKDRPLLWTHLCGEESKDRERGNVWIDWQSRRIANGQTPRHSKWKELDTRGKTRVSYPYIV